MTVKPSDETVRESDRAERRRQEDGLDLTRPLPPEPSLNIGWLLELPYRAVDQAVFELLAERGHAAVRPAHRSVFLTVGSGGARITDMAERASLTKQSMQYLVDDLEALGYVERFADPRDRRAKLVRLTPLGREATLVAREAIASVEARWAQLLGAEAMTELRRTLETLVERLEN